MIDEQTAFDGLAADQERTSSLVVPRTDPELARNGAAGYCPHTGRDIVRLRAESRSSGETVDCPVTESWVYGRERLDQVIFRRQVRSRRGPPDSGLKWRWPCVLIDRTELSYVRANAEPRRRQGPSSRTS